MLEIILRKEAREQGLSRYFTGKPCRNGHLEERNTNSGTCYGCSRANTKKYLKTEKGKEKFKIGLKKYQQSEKGKKAQKKANNNPNAIKSRKNYQQSEAGKIAIKKSRQQPSTKASIKKYQKSEKGKIASAKGQRTYYKKNPSHKVAHNLRNVIRETLKIQNIPKSKKFIELLGCSSEELITQLERDFLQGMSWENYGLGNGRWHVDHIIPLDYFVKNFDMNDLYIQKIAFHFSNLQPLWQEENLSKRNFIDKVEAEKKIAEIKKLIKI